jgi:hypothetical protein
LLTTSVPIINGYLRVGIDPNGEQLPLPPNVEQVVREPFIPSAPAYQRITFETSDSPDVVVDFFNRAMTERGWELASSPTYPNVYSRITLENRDLYVILDTQVLTNTRTVVTLTPTFYSPKISLAEHLKQK